MKAIETNKLTKYYGSSRGIIDLDLSVDTGEFFGFIGPNGAGKSTLIRTLLGLIRPTSGSATVFGMDIVKEKTALLSKVGYVPADTAFYKGMKVRDILRYSAQMRGVDCSDYADSLCERLKLDTTRTVDSLSYGNKKKVAIVCAMQHQPDLYILDEPTSGLDPLMQKEFYSILQEQNEKGATVFLSSHILNEIERYCKRAAVIREGRILVCDQVDRLGHSGIKRVCLRGTKNFVCFEDAKDVKIDRDVLTFLYSGDQKDLLQRLTTVDFQDISITDPELEEVILHYYTREGERFDGILS